MPRLDDIISIGGGGHSLDVSVLRGLASRAESVEKGLSDSAETLRRQIHDLDWSGAARDAATSRADHEYDDVRKLADAYGRLGELSTGAYNDMSYASSFLTATALQLMADGFTVEQDWTVRAPSNGDEARAAADTASLQAQAGQIGSAMEMWAPQIAAVVAELRAFAPSSAGTFRTDPIEITELKKRGAGAGPASLHEQLLARYNVTPDPNGTVMFPADPDSAVGKMLGSMGIDPKELTAGEADMLSRLNLHGVAAAVAIEQLASDGGHEVFADEPRKGGIGDGHADAFRHAYWNAMLTKEFGAEWTEAFTTAHERIDDPDRTHATAEAMDLYNNEVGRRIAAENPTASNPELYDLVKQAVLDGQMVVVGPGPDNHLMYSNRVDPGFTGQTDREPPARGWARSAGRGRGAEEWNVLVTVRAKWVLLLMVPVVIVAGVFVVVVLHKLDQRGFEQDRELSVELRELWYGGGNTSLRALAGDGWDRVHIYQQDLLGRDQVESEVGAPVPMPSSFDREGVTVLVFLKGEDVLRAGWVDVPLISGVYTSEVTLTAAGYPKYIELRDPEPVGPRLAADPELAAKLVDLRKSRGSALLRDLTGGDWDRVYILTAHTRARVEAFVGAPVEMEPVFTPQVRILVFTKGGTVQRATYVAAAPPEGVFSSEVLVDGSRGMPLPPLFSDPTPPG
ncbi:DUF6973 domain-containing protein [Nocardia harenae]|uniref:DUF6973 domain-containing protein n=1 Tax=Nocardia harenae TaxID=358707 RepID=UPI0012EEC31F|nr:hypothetical protein [Nocardia harenae]